jgi:hypothetical protein
MWPPPYYRPGLALAVSAVIAWGNAAADRQFCLARPWSWSCDNPQAPGPEFPHEEPQMPTGSIASVFIAAATGTVAPPGAAILPSR